MQSYLIQSCLATMGKIFQFPTNGTNVLTKAAVIFSLISISIAFSISVFISEVRYNEAEYRRRDGVDYSICRKQVASPLSSSSSAECTSSQRVKLNMGWRKLQVAIYTGGPRSSRSCCLRFRLFSDQKTRENLFI